MTAVHSVMAESSNHDASKSSSAHETDPKSTQHHVETNGDEAPAMDPIITLTVKLPHEPSETKITVGSQEQVQDVRQSIVDQPFALQYTCFHLEHKGERVNDFVELSDVPGLTSESTFTLVEDPYNEKEARMHVMRIRELIGAAGERFDPVHGIDAGISLHDHLATQAVSTNGHAGHGHASLADQDLSDYNFNGPASYKSMLAPVQPPAPKVIKAISLSPYNPPPYHLRTAGHLLYLIVTTNEGEQYHVTAHVSGFFVSKSSYNKFDPFPKTGPKSLRAHSLLTLIQKISPSFEKSLQALLEYNARREPLALYQLQNAIPASPWLVHAPTTSNHQADLARTQEAFLMTGADGSDTLRDWNEEFQTTRELPVETVQDKIFRERLTNKLFADYNDAAVKGAVLVAQGEVPALNPTEGRDAQIFVYNNIFFSFGADGVGTFATEGGDEAARVATGKDVAGVRAVNQLDIKGLFTPGTVIVDYLGKRIVAQSIVPGIFKQQEPGDHQIDYGGVEGKDIVAHHEAFVPLFEKLSTALHVKRHCVWDKEGKRHELEGSIETKGLIGTDGRKYALDLYRLTPLDIPWIEQHWSGEETQASKEKPYPHRMTVLRPELIGAYAREKLNEYLRTELSKKASDAKATVEQQITNGDDGNQVDTENDQKPETAGKTELTVSESQDLTVAKKNSESETENPSIDSIPRVDMANFNFTLNPDVFSGQKPQTEQEIEEMANDEAEVRAACTYLTSTIIPSLIKELEEGEVGFPMDGESLSTLIHKRGINLRYLGSIASMSTSENPRVKSLRGLAMQEMVSRGFKHVASKRLRHLPFVFAPACIAHLLNCLLGVGLNVQPTAEVDGSLRPLYPEADFEFENVTPESLQAEIREQVSMRYRFDLDAPIVEVGKEPQMLREISLKLGLQLIAKDYVFRPEESQVNGNGHSLDQAVSTTSPAQNAPVSSVGKKKKSKIHSSSREDSPAPVPQIATFRPEDILNFVPRVKEASPKSVLAEEAYEAGRISLAQNDKDIGQELLLESLSLFEQIYGILHPEVARIYLQLATLYYSLDDKNAAVELCRKAVIVSERTLGVDAAETLSAYLNLALFEHANGNSKLALTYVLHALELWKIVYGPNHPDSITTINNAAVMLQSAKRYHESRVWFEASLSLAEKMTGKASVNAATLLFQLAQALALDRDHHAAVNRMHESCTIFRTLLGPDDRNTREAESWLDSLTQNAVSVAKRQKDIQSGKIRVHRGFSAAGLRMGARPQAAVGQTADVAKAAAQPRQQPSELDNRSIDELIKYIDGDAGAKKKSGAKKKPTNPKARKTAAVS